MSGTLDDIGLQIRILGALQAHPQVREAFLQMHLPIAALFDSPAMRELAQAALADRPTRLQTESAQEIQFYEAVARIFTPTDAAWGLDLLRLLIAVRCERILPPTLRWAADALEKRWTSPERVKRLVQQALKACDAAEGTDIQPIRSPRAPRERERGGARPPDDRPGRGRDRPHPPLYPAASLPHPRRTSR
jgi:hypothetical protein